MMQERFEIGIIHKEELTETKIREANNRLSPLGVLLVPEPSGSGTYLLTVRVRKNSRNAGKHKISFLDKGISCTAQQIRDIIREEGADAAAEYLGCSRATLFRRLKESEKDPSAFF